MCFAHVGDERFFAAPLVPGADHDGGAVRVVGAQVDAAVAAQLLESHPDVGLDVLDQVPQVNVSVGVRQGGRDQNFPRLSHRDFLLLMPGLPAS